MKLTGNTIFITGGGTGIGRGLAEALHKLGNKVIISGRRRAQLDAVAKANPGIDTVELDVSSPESIDKVAAELIAKYPTLNVLFNNAGIMAGDNAAAQVSDDTLVSEIDTNLLGPIRLTSALIDHLKKQTEATVLYNTSALAFTPLADFAVYSATKAALHSYALSQRFRLRNTSVKVQEIAPPWVGTGLAGDADDPRAVPLDRFIDGTIAALANDSEEVLIDEAKAFRNNAGPNEHAFFNQVNTMMENAFA